MGEQPTNAGNINVHLGCCPSGKANKYRQTPGSSCNSPMFATSVALFAYYKFRDLPLFANH
ncbi:hypothetical protein TorRG33x02_139540 [Trema orientale]|uniref:Uncharacterized protein n=1 Tax=Trema orientale TaxID=63057 RepID=A0A2P5EXN4_TREOI|nr:hypothetical protein TorRG33x02_139540 [Trema orientale]